MRQQEKIATSAECLIDSQFKECLVTTLVQIFKLINPRKEGSSLLMINWEYRPNFSKGDAWNNPTAGPHPHFFIRPTAT
jgi:hypothetical protein